MNRKATSTGLRPVRRHLQDEHKYDRGESGYDTIIPGKGHRAAILPALGKADAWCERGRAASRPWHPDASHR